MSGESSPTRTNWSAVEALFAHALDVPPDQRQPLLAQCTDVRVRAAVSRLLARHDQLEDEAATDPLGTFDHARAATLVMHEELAPGATVQGYRIVRTLGEGSMGTVYQATDAEGRDVALKVLAPYLDDDPLVVRRFLDEARIAAALDHPNVASIHEVMEGEDGSLCIALALCTGGTLRDRLMDGALPLDDVVRIGAQLASALAAAHARGIVHRDVKPENVLFADDGAARITDFGAASVAGRQLTRTGMTLGTAAYMSPEQTRGEPVDHRSDIWSLGVVLYEMTTGARPFGPDRGEQLLLAIRHAAPESVTATRADAPSWLAALIGRCLEKLPARRPDSAEEISVQLQHHIAGKS